MTLLMLLFWLIVGGTLQAAVPAWRHMGQPAFPILLGVVLYAALNKKARYFVAAAILAGECDDWDEGSLYMVGDLAEAQAGQGVAAQNQVRAND